MAGKKIVIDVDSRKRASLGRLARHERYIGEVSDDGVITLTPAKIVPLPPTRRRPGPQPKRD
jgi:hypothetical protein